MYGNIRVTPWGASIATRITRYDNDDPNTTDDLSDDIVLKKRVKRYYLEGFEPWTTPEHINKQEGQRALKRSPEFC